MKPKLSRSIHCWGAASPQETLKRKLYFQQKESVRVIEPLGNNNSFFIKYRTAEYAPTVWVVSPGGSGSSLLYDNLNREFETCPYPVFKSHSYHTVWKGKDCIKAAAHGGYMWEIEKDDKVIYLYGHPLNILLSFYHKIYEDDTKLAWCRGNPHYVEFLECDIEKDFFEVYLDEDILGLERHLDKWWKKKDFDLLCVKYENLHDTQNIIRKFIEGPTQLTKGGNHEVPLKLPPKRERKTDWRKNPHKEQLLQTYASVIEKFEQKPPYELFAKENKR